MGPGDMYHFVAMGRALGAIGSHGAMGMVWPPRAKKVGVSIHFGPTSHRRGTRKVQVVQTAPDIGEATVGRSHP